MSDTALHQFDAFAQQLSALRAGASSSGIQRFSDQARAASALLEALPARYREVLLQLLDRLESSALFCEESCSFSQRDLLDSLGLWVDKARAQLDAAAQP